MAADAPRTFAFDNWLADRDMKFSRRDDDGTVFVTDPKGEERRFNLDALKADIATKSGMDPKDLKDAPVQFNTALTPTEISPLGFGDRTAVKSFGNIKGATSYLKNKYDDVQYNPEKGLVVNNKGVWQTVDPSGLGKGTAWDKTKELFKDVVDNQDIAIAGMMSSPAVAEGVALGAPAGPIGMAVGGIAGAGVAALGSSAVRTTFGRMLGTYESTPVEQVQDMGMETIMGMAGQAAAPGVSAGISALGKAGSSLGKLIPEAVQGTFANVYGRITGVGTQAMYSLMGQGEKLMGRLKNMAGAVGPKASAEDIAAHAVKENISTASTLLEESTKALPRKYGEMLHSLVDNSEGKVSVDMEDLVSNTMKQVEDAGMGRFVPTVSKGGAKSRNAMERAGAELPPPEMSLKHGQVKFVPYSQEELATRWSQGLPAEVLEGESKGKVMKFVNQMLVLGKQGQLEGKSAANVLTRAKGMLNQVADEAFQSGDSQMQRLMAKTKEGWDNNVRAVFDDAGLGKDYSQLSELYANFGNAVNKARGILKKEGEETFVKKLVSSADKNLTAKGDAGLLVELLGDRGKDLYDNIMLTDTAAKFAPWIPRFGPAGHAGIVGVASAAGAYAPKAVSALAASAGLGTGVAAGAVASQFSPKIVSGQVRAVQEIAKKAAPYVGKTMDFVKGLPPDHLKEFIKNPQAMEAFLRTVPASMVREEQDREHLLSGVK